MALDHRLVFSFDKYEKVISNWAEVYIWVKRLSRKELPSIIKGRWGEVLVSFYLYGKDCLCWNIVDKSNDGNFDLYYKDYKVDVKTCTYFKDPELKEYTSKKKLADDELYCLVSLDVERKKYTIQGFISKQNFFQDKNLVPNWKGKGPRYIAKKKDLVLDI